MENELPYRRGAGLVILNHEDQVLVFERSDVPGAWQLPQGGVEAGESSWEGALRELEEETCLPAELIHLIEVMSDKTQYDLPPEIQKKKGFKGQCHIWFLCRFLGKDDDIKPLEAKDCEFSAFRWVPFETLPDIAVDFRRGVYEAIVDAFQPMVRK